ncbi:MAG TPA: tRNA (adenosine(37)-N6)-threonylcarbamoyltransferase complex dimerization subunit type 1 TsaB [Kofleriaceae bacterium]|nr:tRNA (adenosine(37)-N6)-threonylcarbamoyltransferase complex dimerization subunit type 1 TsaB [Kofleriaceae bacterium]
MIVLAIDTSTLRASVALVQEDPDRAPRVLAERAGDTARHSDNLLPLIDQVLADAGRAIADVEAVAIGAGPGSFTGLRIGMATAKGLAFSMNVPLWAASSLAALALDGAAALAPGAIVVAVLDARRDEIFTGAFRVAAAGTIEPLGAEAVLAPGDLASHLQELGVSSTAHIVGDGLAAYAGELQLAGTLHGDVRATPSAVSIAQLVLRGDRTDIVHLGAPAYIRKSEAELKFPHGNPGPSGT